VSGRRDGQARAVTLDGTKLQANSGGRKAMTYARMKAKEKILAQQVSDLLADAEQIDKGEDAQFDKQLRRSAHKNLQAPERDIRTLLATWNENPQTVRLDQDRRRNLRTIQHTSSRNSWRRARGARDFSRTGVGQE
jgi:hypothetical protein